MSCHMHLAVIIINKSSMSEHCHFYMLHIIINFMLYFAVIHFLYASIAIQYCLSEFTPDEQLGPLRWAGLQKTKHLGRAIAI